MVLIGTGPMVILELKCVVGTTTVRCDRPHQELSVAVMTIMVLEVGAPIGITAGDEVDRGHRTVDMDDIEVVALKDQIQMTKLTYPFHEGTLETFLMSRSF